MNAPLKPCTTNQQVQVFDPQAARASDAKADAFISYAQRVKDWSALENAVARKLEDQAVFVKWWDETVGVHHGAGRGNKKVAGQQSFSVEEAEAQTGITKHQVSRWRRRLKEPEKYREMLYGAAYHKAMAETDKNIATKWTGDPEWYTPRKYIEAAREVMGGIDLDPASNDLAQKTVKADQWFGENDNGLEQNWRGRVFLNPPFAFPLIAHFVGKLCADIESGKVTSAILLTNNNTDTKWWHLAARHSKAVCFTAGRINFYKGSGEEAQPTNGQTFFYFGDGLEAFKRSFSEFGLIQRPGWEPVGNEQKFGDAA